MENKFSIHKENISTQDCVSQDSLRCDPERSQSKKYYATSREHILAELERIDLLIRIQVQKAQRIHQNDSQFQGLYISDTEINSLLELPLGKPRWAVDPSIENQDRNNRNTKKVTAEITTLTNESIQQNIFLRLPALIELFDLTPFDKNLLLICLAPEIDLRYHRIYAYLQDDITKTSPSVDLVLNLLCSSFEDKLAARKRFTPQSPLLEYLLVNTFHYSSQAKPPLLQKFLKVDERIVEFLLDSDEIDSELRHYAQITSPQIRFEELLLPHDLSRRLLFTACNNIGNNQGPLYYFQGPYGAGKHTTAQAICGKRKLKLLKIDCRRLLETRQADIDIAIGRIKREIRLQKAALYLDGFDLFLADDRRTGRDILISELEAWPGLVFLAGETPWKPRDAFHSVSFLPVIFPRPTSAERLQLWKRALNTNTRNSELDLEAISAKFRFTAGQIRDATTTARNIALWRDPEKPQIQSDDIYAGCRQQSSRKLSILAKKIHPIYLWGDIVLPEDQLQQLREICNHVIYRTLVYDRWGFGRKLSMGKGLNVLFAGPSGTGKTMAAEILANELQLELYKIDLSQVVSKYIGETEKNLNRIFSEAETSNSILFFDEADALFGKRSEVKDAHDRYANIEVGYLLQKMEEYEGITILATNLRQNMDEAFVRRMQCIVDFPFPDETHRYKIWEVHFPKEAPRSDNIDLKFLARQFKLAGGNIKNIVVNGSFLAAANAKKIDMEHLILATKRELQKMGKLCVKNDFGKYYSLLDAGQIK